MRLWPQHAQREGQRDGVARGVQHALPNALREGLQLGMRVPAQGRQGSFRAASLQTTCGAGGIHRRACRKGQGNAPVHAFTLLQRVPPAPRAPVQQRHEHVQQRRHGRPAWVCLRQQRCLSGLYTRYPRLEGALFASRGFRRAGSLFFSTPGSSRKSGRRCILRRRALTTPYTPRQGASCATLATSRSPVRRLCTDKPG